MKKVLFFLFAVMFAQFAAAQTAGSSPCSAIHLYPQTGCTNSSGAQFAGYYQSEDGNGANVTMAGTTTLNPGCTTDNETTETVEWLAVTATATSFTITNETNYIGGGSSTAEKRDYIIYSGPCGSLTQIACGSEVLNGGTVSVTGLTVGQTYYIMVSQSATALTQCASCTTAATCITSTVPYTPTNDNCLNAIPLTTNIPISSTNADATGDGPATCGSVENNIWYQWCAPSTWPSGQTAYVNINSLVCNSTHGLQLSVFPAGTTCASITAGTATPIYCDNPNATTNFSYTFTPTANSCYYINIDGYAGTGCTFLVEVGTSTVVCSPPTITTIASPSNSICGSGSTTLTASGASTYTWSPATGLSTSSGSVTVASPTVTTTYIINGTSSGCSGSSSITVSVTPTPTVTVNSPTVCSGSSATLTASGATSYSWTPSTGLSSTTGTTVTATTTTTAQYTVTGTTNGCSATNTSTVTVNPTPTVTVNSATLCAGATATLTASGATSYSWSPSTGLSATSGSVVTANPAATTSYVVTGTTGSCTSTSTAVVTVNPNPTVTVNSATICFGNTATFTANGATSYNWAPSTGLSATTGSTVTSNASSSQVYTVTGTTGTCTSSATASLTVNPTPTVTVNSATICSGNTATFTASGATTYNWNPSTGLSATSGSVVTSNAISSVDYTVTGTTGSCTNTVVASLIVNATPTISVNNTTICPGNTATLTASGGPSYTWSPSTGLSSTTGATVTATPTTTTTYTIISANGICADTTTAIVTVVNSLTVTANSPTICFGSSGTLTATGATTYTWSPATGLSSTSGASVIANPTVTTVYTVDGASGSCSSSFTTTVTVNPTPTVSASALPSTICSGATTTLSASGANTFTWSTGTAAATETVSPTSTTSYTVLGETNACLDSFVVTVTVTPLPSLTVTATPATLCMGQSTVLNASGASTFTWSANAGSAITPSVSVSPTTNTTYTVSGTDNGCIDSTVITVAMAPSPTVSAVASPTMVCSGQSSTIHAFGATSYTWDTGSNLDSIVVSPGVQTTYTLIGANSQGCTDTTTVMVDVTPTPTPVATPGSGTICFSDSTTLTASGATSYTWSTGSTAGTITVTPTSQTTYTLIGSANGCIDSSTVTVNVTPLPNLTINPNPAGVCAGQSILLTGNGATSYAWSSNAGGAITDTVTVSPMSNTTYTLIGTQSGCSDSTTITVTVGTAPSLTVTASQSVICSGQSVTLNASGASAYSWSPFAATGSSISVLLTNTTTFTLTGNNGGCSDSTTITVTVTPLPNVAAVASPPNICSGDSSMLVASGATSYTWSTNAGSTVNDTVHVSPSTPGITIYTVTGEDQNCTATQTVAVNVTTTPTLAATSTPGTVCSGDTALLVATGATTYSWSSNAASTVNDTAIVTPSTGTSITYTVIGANGICLDTTTVSVNIKPKPIVSLTSVPTQICQGDTAILSATSPTGAATFTWTPSGTVNDTLIANPTQTTTYVVNADLNGCPGQSSITLTVNPVPVLTTVSGQTVCAGGQVQPITFSAGSGATYTWTNNNTNIGLGAGGTGSTIAGYTSPSVTTQQSGTVTVAASFSTGCTGLSQTFVITINPSPSLTGGVPDTAKCSLPTGGVHLLTAAGGTAPLAIQWVGPTGTVPGAITPTLTGVPAGTYTIIVTDANNCPAVGTSTFTVPGTTQPLAGIVPSTLGGQAPLSVSFGNTSVGATSYFWNLGNGTTATSITSAATYTMSGTYTVTLMAYNAGCMDMDTVMILVNDATTIAVPNIFSPNGDNINDEWYVLTTGMQTLHCDIFNRWGQKVFSLGNPTAKWDGKMDNGNEATEGTYYYVLEALGYDGKSYSYKGPITLVK